MVARVTLVRYTAVVRAKDLAMFAGRDWRALEASKEAQWLTERRRRGVRWCLEVAEELRRQVVQQRPDWPTLSDREADLAMHVRVGHALRRVGHAGGH
jgi:hypothetical protein